MENINRLKIISYVLCSGIAFSGSAFAEDQVVQPMTDTIQTEQGLTDSNTSASDSVVVTDQELKTQAEAALLQYASQVGVLVDNGIISLSGQLDSTTDYENVIVLVESIKGSKSVNVDALKVKDSTQPLLDTYITAKVKGSLIKTDLLGADIASWTIGVETKDGKVYLSGTVASEQEKQKILDEVNSLTDVKGVDDQLQVKTTNGTDDKSMNNGNGATDDSSNQSDTNNSNDGSM